MISRRIIRVKVLQVLYAYYANSENSMGNAEKELFFSLKKTFDLYHYLLYLSVEVADYAISIIELHKRKNFPTEEDLNPNTVFVDNRIIGLLRSNKELNLYLEKNKFTWEDNQKFIKKLYHTLVKTDLYKNYIASGKNNFKDDKTFIKLFYEEIVLQSETLNELLEEKSIYWNDDLDFVISMVIKTIKSFREDSNDNFKILPFFKDEDDRQFAKDLLTKSIVHHDELIAILKNHTKNWDIERIANIDNLIMELAIIEFLYFPTIPTKVSLNEYIELSKYYSTEKSPVFINGILDNVVKNLRSENKIEKRGRGLIGEDKNANLKL